MEPDAVIVMKAGPHAGESLRRIYQRKALEESASGAVWWGYGGSKLHPVRQVQEFARKYSRVTVALFETRSDPGVDGVAAQTYSIDEQRWLPIPDGVRVTGSTRALVFREFGIANETLDLADYEVAMGSGEGTAAVDYFHTPSRAKRTEAACLRRVVGRHERRMPTPVQLQGILTSPFGVFLRLSE